MGFLFRWLPVGFDFNCVDPVEWIDFGNEFLTDPFFFQTLNRLTSKTPPAVSRRTSVVKLIESSAKLPYIEPAGVIFHISRCGSTLLSNTLRLGSEAVVFSEALPIKQLMYHKYGTNGDRGIEAHQNSATLEAVLKLYAKESRYEHSRIVIKCQPEDVFILSRLRKLWPTVPFVIVIRHPVEVIVSNLAGPGGWMRELVDGLSKPNIFRHSAAELRQMTVEEFCTKAVSEFLVATNSQVDNNCCIMDYTDLVPTNIRAIGKLFGIEMPPTFENIMTLDAKDGSRTKLFTDDREQKQNEASELVRQLALSLAEEPYRALLSKRIPFER